MRFIPLTAVLAAATLSACTGLVPYTPGPNTVIASNHDTGINSGVLKDGHAAVVYDPDGCQGWLMDDGVEGYAGRRFDPKSGLPVCNSLYPPGTVLGDYRQQNEATSDWVPTY